VLVLGGRWIPEVPARRSYRDLPRGNCRWWPRAACGRHRLAGNGTPCVRTFSDDLCRWAEPFGV